ncbi:MAG: uncharacterized protein A8A55_2856, partial [Amphiamblys sp. WSBS2006]
MDEFSRQHQKYYRPLKQDSALLSESKQVIRFSYLLPQKARHTLAQMEPETTQTLKIGSIFFIFTHQSLFLVPEHEHERIQQTEEGYVCLERKYLPEIATRDTERVT